MVGKETKALLRRSVKTAAAVALEGSGARRALAMLRRRNVGGRRVQIYAWHRVVPDFEAARRRMIPGLFTSTATFDRQLAWLSKNYAFATLGEALEVLTGARHAARDICVLTFDDGYSDFLPHALPILRKHGASATIYVPTGFVGTGKPLLHDRLYLLLRLAAERRLPLQEVGGGKLVREALADARRGDPIWALERLLETRPRELCVQVAEALEATLGVAPDAAVEGSRLLDWDELRQLGDAGISVGAHTIDHACLPNEAPAEVERQLLQSRMQLESELQTQVTDFAYPNGWYSRGAIRALMRLGYRSAVTTEDRPNRLGEDPFSLKRKCVWEFTSRGIAAYSPAVNACNFDDTLGQLGLAGWVHGERPDALGFRLSGGESGESPVASSTGA